MALSVFAFVGVADDADVAVVSGLADEVFLHGGEHSASRLVRVGAVVEFAFGRGFEDLGSISMGISGRQYRSHIRVGLTEMEITRILGV